MTNIIEPNEDLKVGEKIETISPETIQVPDYSYGIAQNTIDGPIGIRNLSSGGSKIFAGSFSYNSTGDKAITGVGFKPTLVTVVGYDNQRAGSFGHFTSYAQSFYRESLDAGGTDYCIINGNPTRSRLKYKSMDSDGFTVNCDYYDPGMTTYVNYIAFG